MDNIEFEERAAIMEYDGGLLRYEAERRAREILEEQLGLFKKEGQ